MAGFGVKPLDPGCVLTVARVTFVSPVAPRVEVQQVVTSFLGSFSFFNEIGTLNRPLSKALDNFDQIDYNAVAPATSRASYIMFVSCLSGNLGVPTVDLHWSVDRQAFPGGNLLLRSQGTMGGGPV